MEEEAAAFGTLESKFEKIDTAAQVLLSKCRGQVALLQDCSEGSNELYSNLKDLYSNCDAGVIGAANLAKFEHYETQLQSLDKKVFGSLRVTLDNTKKEYDALVTLIKTKLANRKLKVKEYTKWHDKLTKVQAKENRKDKDIQKVADLTAESDKAKQDLMSENDDLRILLGDFISSYQDMFDPLVALLLRLRGGTTWIAVDDVGLKTINDIEVGLSNFVFAIAERVQACRDPKASDLAYESPRIDQNREFLRLRLAHPVTRLTFRQFLKEEHAEENLDFWEAAINYSQLEEDIERIDEAAKIFNQHFAQGAPQEINVPQTTQQAIEAKYTKGEVTLLDDALEAIEFNLMNDSWSRFMASTFYIPYKRRLYRLTSSINSGNHSASSSEPSFSPRSPRGSSGRKPILGGLKKLLGRRRSGSTVSGDGSSGASQALSASGKRGSSKGNLVADNSDASVASASNVAVGSSPAPPLDHAPVESEHSVQSTTEDYDLPEEFVKKQLEILSENMGRIVNETKTGDIHITVGAHDNKKTFYAHSAILDARCRLFLKTHPPTTDPTTGIRHIALEATSARAFKCFLDFVYTGHISDVNSGTLSELTHLATVSHMAALEDMCAAHAFARMDPIALCAELNRNFPTEPAPSSDDYIKYDTCLATLAKHASVVFNVDNHPGLEHPHMALHQSHLHALLDRADLIVENELQVFNFVVEWANNHFDADHLRDEVHSLLEQVRYPFINPEDLRKVVEPLSLVHSGLLFEAYRFRATGEVTSTRCRPRIYKPINQRHVSFAQVSGLPPRAKSRPTVTALAIPRTLPSELGSLEQGTASSPKPSPHQSPRATTSGSIDPPPPSPRASTPRLEVTPPTEHRAAESNSNRPSPREHFTAPDISASESENDKPGLQRSASTSAIGTPQSSHDAVRLPTSTQHNRSASVAGSETNSGSPDPPRVSPRQVKSEIYLASDSRLAASSAATQSKDKEKEKEKKKGFGSAMKSFFGRGKKGDSEKKADKKVEKEKHKEEKKAQKEKEKEKKAGDSSASEEEHHGEKKSVSEKAKNFMKRTSSVFKKDKAGSSDKSDKINSTSSKDTAPPTSAAPNVIAESNAPASPEGATANANADAKPTESSLSASTAETPAVTSQPPKPAPQSILSGEEEDMKDLMEERRNKRSLTLAAPVPRRGSPGPMRPVTPTGSGIDPNSNASDSQYLDMMEKFISDSPGQSPARQRSNSAGGGPAPTGGYLDNLAAIEDLLKESDQEIQKGEFPARTPSPGPRVMAQRKALPVVRPSQNPAPVKIRKLNAVKESEVPSNLDEVERLLAETIAENKKEEEKQMNAGDVPATPVAVAPIEDDSESLPPPPPADDPPATEAAPSLAHNTSIGTDSRDSLSSAEKDPQPVIPVDEVVQEIAPVPTEIIVVGDPALQVSLPTDNGTPPPPPPEDPEVGQPTPSN